MKRLEVLLNAVGCLQRRNSIYCVGGDAADVIEGRAVLVPVLGPCEV